MMTGTAASVPLSPLGVGWGEQRQLESSGVLTLNLGLLGKLLAAGKSNKFSALCLIQRHVTVSWGLGGWSTSPFSGENISREGPTC